MTTYSNGNITKAIVASAPTNWQAWYAVWCQWTDTTGSAGDILFINEWTVASSVWMAVGWGIQSVVAWTDISVDNTDPLNPIVSYFVAPPSPIELRVSNSNLLPFWYSAITSVTVSTLTIWWVDYLPSFTTDLLNISPTEISIWNILDSAPTWSLDIYLNVVYDWWVANQDFNLAFTWPFAYVKANPSTIPVDMV